MGKLFKFLGGDCDWATYGGKWYRQTGDNTYHVIELFNWEEACGRDAPDDTYHVGLSEVDISDLERVQEALSSCGWKLSLVSTGGAVLSGLRVVVVDDYSGDCVATHKSTVRLCLVEALHSYGAKAPLGQWNGNNHAVLRRQARELALELDDPTKYEAAMEKPVNQIGSSAREYQRGDIQAAVRRGVKAGSVEAEIIHKMQLATEGHTLGGKTIPGYGCAPCPACGQTTCDPNSCPEWVGATK